MARSRKTKNKASKKHRFIHRIDGKKDISRKNVSSPVTDEKETYIEEENFIFIQQDLKKIGFIIGFIIFIVLALYLLNFKMDLSNLILNKFKF